MMFTELEIALWACLNDKKLAKKPETCTIRMAYNRLIMTAFFTKKRMCSEEHFKIFEAFFAHNFPSFMGKYTEWDLLEAPDDSEFSMKVVNTKYKQLNKRYIEGDQRDLIDFNYEVDMLEAENHRRDVLTTGGTYLQDRLHEVSNEDSDSRLKARRNKDNEPQTLQQPQMP